MRILKQRKTAGQKNVRRHARNAERVTTKITKGDAVRIVRGEDKGKDAKVLRVDLKAGRVTLEGKDLKMNKRHRRARTAEEQSGIIEMPRSVAISNVMLLDPKSGEPTRIRARIDADGTKERISAKSGQAIPRAR
jgi:large subunit ribosomal protein L24